MQKNTTSHTASTSMDNSTDTLPSVHPTLSDFQLQQQFHNTALNDFINAVCDNTVHPQLWLLFCDKIKDKQAAYLQKLIHKINILSARYELAQAAVKYFEVLEQIAGMEPDADVIKVLQSFIAISPTDNLQKILDRSAGLLMQLDILKKEYETLKPVDDGEQPGYEFFTQIIVSVQKHVKFQINKKDTTVAEFAQMIVDLRNEIERPKK